MSRAAPFESVNCAPTSLPCRSSGTFVASARENSGEWNTAPPSCRSSSCGSRAVVEPRPALEREAHLAPHRDDLAHESPRVARVAVDRHEVVHLADAVGGEEARDQDVRVGEVQLPASSGRRSPGRSGRSRPSRRRGSRRTRSASRTAGSRTSRWCRRCRRARRCAGRRSRRARRWAGTRSCAGGCVPDQAPCAQGEPARMPGPAARCGAILCPPPGASFAWPDGHAGA